MSEGRYIDLDAARAARAETRGDNPRIRLGGNDYELVPEAPIEILELLTDNRVRAAVALLLVDSDQTDAFMAHRPSEDDMRELVQGVYRLDGVGESSASPRSSASTSKRSRPTSRTGTTTT